jgi:undecaprenyl-diphosphatase
MVAAARFARAEAVLIAALSLVAILIGIFAEIASDLAEHPDHAWDLSVLNALRESGQPDNPIGPRWLEIAMTDLTALGGVAVLVAVGLIVVGFLLVQRRPLGVMTLVTALGGGLALSQAMKLLFGRERPPLIYRAAEAVNASFPSGHAMLSAVAYLTIGAILARSMQRTREKLYVMGVALILTFVVGVSRIYLGVHWATDVLGGWSIGVAWATTCWAAAWAAERWHGREGMSRPQGLQTEDASDTPAAVTGE